jgi:hypothetical protein
VVLGLSGYWALRIRRVLAPSSRFYRNQALGIVLVTTSLAILNIEANTLGDPYSNLIGVPFLYFAFLTIFYWTDSSALAARRSDLLSRDNLHWSKVRLLLWAFNIVSVGYFLLLVVATGGHVPSPTFQAGPLTVPGALLLLTGTIFVAMISAGVMLPIVARRATDSTLRRHLAWFGLGIVFLVIPLFPAAGVVGDFAIFGLSYCMYRSAKHLIPLNRLPLA